MSSEITQLINAAESGDAQASRELFEQVYADLKRMAATRLAGERAGHTLQPTALVHEVYLRLFGLAPEAEEPRAGNWKSRAHFSGLLSVGERRRRCVGFWSRRLGLRGE